MRQVVWAAAEHLLNPFSSLFFGAKLLYDYGFWRWRKHTTVSLSPGPDSATAAGTGKSLCPHYTDKKNVSSYIRKFRGSDAKSYMTTDLLLYGENICAFPHILGSPSSYMTFQSEFPCIWGKFSFSVVHCYLFSLPAQKFYIALALYSALLFSHKHYLARTSGCKIHRGFARFGTNWMKWGRGPRGGN